MEKLLTLLLVIAFIAIITRRAEAVTDKRCEVKSPLYSEAQVFVNRISEFMPIIDKESQANSLDKTLVMAIVWQESSGFPDAVRWENTEVGYSFGLMGLTLPAARDMGFTGMGVSLLIPEVNVKYGCKYLRWQINRYNGDVRKGVSAYNAGHYTEANRSYVDSVFSKKEAIWQVLYCQK